MRCFSIAVAVLSLIPVVALASEAKGPNRLFQQAAAGGSPVSLALDAATIANEGPFAADLFVAAARIAAKASPSASTRSKKTEGGKAASSAHPVELDPMKLLEKAAGGAAAGSDLAKHIMSLQAAGLPAGKRGKTYHQTESVAGGATDVFEISFKAAEPAQVGVVGLGGSDLDLRVFDEAWNEICASTSDSAREYCSWVPATTGLFRVRVRNQGKAADDYVFVTN